MAALPVFGDEGGHDVIDALSGKKSGVDAKCSMGRPCDFKPVLLYSGSLLLLLEPTSHCTLGKLGVAMLQPCVLVKGDSTNILKQVPMHAWLMLCHKIGIILWNYCMLCWKCMNWSGKNMDIQYQWYLFIWLCVCLSHVNEVCVAMKLCGQIWGH